MTRTEIENIKYSNDLISIIESMGIDVRQNKALCPFHEDTKPSLYVWPESQRFKCFACGESGDVIDFVMKFKRLSFLEALRYLGADIPNHYQSRNGNQAPKAQKSVERLRLEPKLDRIKQTIKVTNDIREAFGKQLYQQYNYLKFGKISPGQYYSRIHWIEHELSILDYEYANLNKTKYKLNSTINKQW